MTLAPALDLVGGLDLHSPEEVIDERPVDETLKSSNLSLELADARECVEFGGHDAVNEAILTAVAALRLLNWGDATFAWDPSFTANGDPVAGYQVDLVRDDRVMPLPSVLEERVDVAILPGDAFAVRVRAFSDTGETSPDSPESVRVEVPYGPEDIDANGCVAAPDFTLLSFRFGQCAPAP